MVDGVVDVAEHDVFEGEVVFSITEFFEIGSCPSFEVVHEVGCGGGDDFFAGDGIG